MLPIHDYLRLVLAVFTLYRLARLIALDDGPLFVFKRIRYWAKDKAWNEVKQEQEISDRWYGKWHNLAEGLSCPFCVGIWLSLPLFAMLVWPTYYSDLFLLLMAISGGQAFLQSLNRD